MHARSALFDLYGDHLRDRGGKAPVAALVRLLAPLGIQPPAVRTAVSRMVRQAWLEPARIAGQPGYALTTKARRRLDDAAARIYRTGDGGWDGSWHLLVLGDVPNRRGREQLRAQLSFLGWVPLSDSTWVGLRHDDEVDAVLAGAGITADRFRAAVGAGDGEFARRAWRLDELGAAYDSWLADTEKLIDAAGPDPDDEEAFAVRSDLVHEWRKFLFRDPGLPPELLPDDWTGTRAAAFFDHHANRLGPAARRFVDESLGGAHE